jgi:hypothetical protein
MSGTTWPGPCPKWLRRVPEAPESVAEPAFGDRVGVESFAAQTDLLWGRMLAEPNAPGGAEKTRDRLTKAHIAATAHGYGTVKRRAAVALQGLG